MIRTKWEKEEVLILRDSDRLWKAKDNHEDDYGDTPQEALDNLWERRKNEVVKEYAL